MTSKAFRLKLPAVRTTSVIFASPHSGHDYSRSFLNRSVLDQYAIRSSEDAFVDLLFADAPLFGAPLMMANSPRAYLDLNRSADELDPALIEGLRRGGHNPRVASGLGVVPRVVANGQSIYRGKISRADADERLSTIWAPYHHQLQQLISQSHSQFAEAILIDCHSMPHEAIETISHGKGGRPDIVLGDRYGAAAGSEVVEQVEAAFACAGLNVVRNAPFAGAYTTEHYGLPSREQHVVQVEINRSLYMNERTIEPNGNFDAFRTLISGVVRDLAGIGYADLPLAAE